MADEAQGRRVLLAGLVDSFGLSLGWTTFTLISVERYGLGAAAIYNAAMLVGIVASAPATMWLSRRLSGRALLRLVGMIELPLRVLTLAALLMDAASNLIAIGVVVMNVAAWTGYAGMRAEVAECDPGSRAMVRYAVGIASIEAVAASIAAVLPVEGKGTATTIALGVVFVLYGASLAPQFWCARNARVPAGRRAVPAPELTVARASTTAQPRNWWNRERLLLLAGTAIMLIASGPATLNTALAADLYGHLSVIAASIAFSVGCLLATRATSWVAVLHARTRTTWTAWAIGMAAGWLAATWSIAGLLLAQALSGLCLTAFHGEMDAAIAQEVPGHRLTGSLAWAGALRAIGSAIAVRLLPLLVAWVGLVSYVSGTLVVVAAAFALSAAVVAVGRTKTAPGQSRRSLAWRGGSTPSPVAAGTRAPSLAVAQLIAPVMAPVPDIAGKE